MSLTAEQLELRRSGIGGSEIAAILGESRFAAPFDVWLSKTQGWQVPETEDMRRGTFLEDGIARWYAQRYGIPDGRMHEVGTIRHAERPLALCTPDRIAILPERDRLVSIKAPRRKSESWGEPGTDHVPPEYLLQLQWECAIYGPNHLDPEMHLAALLDGDLAVYVVQADRELQAWMLDAAEAWWERHVVRGEAPPLDGSSQAGAWLKRRFEDKGLTRPATPREVRLLVELELAEREAEARAAEVETIENEVRLSMGEAARIEAPNGVVTWKADKNGKRSLRKKWINQEE